MVNFKLKYFTLYVNLIFTLNDKSIIVYLYLCSYYYLLEHEPLIDSQKWCTYQSSYIVIFCITFYKLNNDKTDNQDNVLYRTNSLEIIHDS